MTAPTRDAEEPTWARQLRTLPPNNPLLRWAWIILGALFAISLIALGAFQLVTLLAHQEDTVVQTFDPELVSALDIGVSTGSITVIATDEPTITVTATVSQGITKTRHRETIEGDTLLLRADCNHFLSKFCSVDYTVEAPAETVVVARTAHSDITITGTTGGITARTQNGSVSANEVSGTLDLRSDNGRVIADVVRGSLRARTDNGSVRASFREAPDDILATSANGSILIVVPDAGTDDLYALDLTSDNGRVNGDVRSDPTSPRAITAHSDNGSVTVRYP